MKTKAVFLATLDTGNFNFQAMGDTKAQALETLKDGWRQHCKESQLETPFSYFADSVWFSTLTSGQCNRDGEKII